jgi:hypothetical protein
MKITAFIMKVNAKFMKVTAFFMKVTAKCADLSNVFNRIRGW